MSQYTTLPEHVYIYQKAKAGKPLTPLEEFILEYEPEYNSSIWRVSLVKAIEYEIENC